MGADVLAFHRGDDTTVVVNMGSSPIELPAGDVIVSSAPVEAGTLPADAAVWLSRN